MTANEIIAQIEALPPEEKAVLVDYLRKVDEELRVIRGNKEIHYVTEAEFNRAQEQVFRKHAPLLKKLAES